MKTTNTYLQIVEWLYTHDKGFNSAKEWRKAFLDFLKTIL